MTERRTKTAADYGDDCVFIIFFIKTDQLKLTLKGWNLCLKKIYHDWSNLVTCTTYWADKKSKQQCIRVEWRCFVCSMICNTQIDIYTLNRIGIELYLLEIYHFQLMHEAIRYYLTMQTSTSYILINLRNVMSAVISVNSYKVSRYLYIVTMWHP